MRITNLIGSLVVVAALFFPCTLRANPASQVGFGVSIRVGPPLLPVYEQPLCPGPGYIWEPGYWDYGDDGYYWVPGIWVEPPEIGLLWTPGYWGFADGLYVWHAGYWGPTVGFYGGIDYGFGYPGSGFYGGYWKGNEYFYNTRVTNVNTTIVHNVYNTNVVNEGRSANRVSFNGGPGGVQARPTAAEQSAARGQHTAMTAEQMQHERAASTNRAMFASVNHGRPDVAASPRPGATTNRAPASNNRPAPVERPPAHNPNESTPPRTERAPAHPATPEPRTAPPHAAPPAERHPAPAPRPEPARPEAAPTHPPAATPSHRSEPAPAHPSNPPAHPQPAAPHAEKPATHAPAPKPASHPSNPKPNTHPAPHRSEPHGAAAPHAPAHSQPSKPSKPSKPEHQQP